LHRRAGSGYTPQPPVPSPQSRAPNPEPPVPKSYNSLV